MFEALQNFVIFLGASLLVMVIWVKLFVMTTPYDDIWLILEDKNEAAAIILMGGILGLLLPVASTVIHSKDFMEFIVWSGISAAIQLLLTWLLSKFYNITKIVTNRNKAAALYVLSIYLVVGVMNAASLS
jgi:putative membrane protein